MSSPLEDFVKNNRAAFDNDEPAANLGAAWKKNLRPDAYGKMKKMRFWAAAAVLLLVIAGFILFKRNGNDVAQNMSPDRIVQTDVLNHIDPEKAKAVQEFSRVISTKRSELVLIKNDHPQLYNRFNQGIAGLDSVYHQLEQALQNQPNEEQVLEAMLQNLELQTELLNHQLTIIKQIHAKNNHHEKKTL